MTIQVSDAYHYVFCGHVQNVKYQYIEFCVLTLDVLASQRQEHKAAMYEAWIIHNKPDYCINYYIQYILYVYVYIYCIYIYKIAWQAK